MPAIRACLEHRHSYVRRNAVLAIYTIYRYKVYSVMYFCHLLFYLLVYFNFQRPFSCEKQITDGIHLLQELRTPHPRRSRADP